MEAYSEEDVEVLAPNVFAGLLKQGIDEDPGGLGLGTQISGRCQVGTGGVVSLTRELLDVVTVPSSRGLTHSHIAMDS